MKVACEQVLLLCVHTGIGSTPFAMATQVVCRCCDRSANQLAAQLLPTPHTPRGSVVAYNAEQDMAVGKQDTLFCFEAASAPYSDKRPGESAFLNGNMSPYPKIDCHSHYLPPLVLLFAQNGLS